MYVGAKSRGMAYASTPRATCTSLTPMSLAWIWPLPWPRTGLPACIWPLRWPRMGLLACN
jgi:hypothetical protein